VKKTKGMLLVIIKATLFLLIYIVADGILKIEARIKILLRR
jgi:hypothetical protein